MGLLAVVEIYRHIFVQLSAYFDRGNITTTDTNLKFSNKYRDIGRSTFPDWGAKQGPVGYSRQHFDPSDGTFCGVEIYRRPSGGSLFSCRYISTPVWNGLNLAKTVSETSKTCKRVLKTALFCVRNDLKPLKPLKNRQKLSKNIRNRVRNH